MLRPLTISVALCTYNGARYLPEQLRSIREQTLRPDELVVCDDASSDNTVELLHEFAKATPFPVNIVTNALNLGSTRNFEQAIRLCRGDITVLCDQDDYWLPSKLQRFVDVFTANPQLQGLFSNAWIARPDLTPTDLDLWSFLGMGRKGRRLVQTGRVLEVLLRRNVVFGSTFGFRTDSRSVFLPIPVPLPGAALHDGWIAFVQACQGTVKGLDEKLSLYRQHHEQQVGATPLPKASVLTRLRRSRCERKALFAADLRTGQQFLDLITSRGIGTGPNIEMLSDRLRHLELRINLPPTFWSRARHVIPEALRGGYRKFTGTILAAPLRDLFAG